MELVNTSVYNDAEVERLVKFACAGLNMENVRVEVRPPVNKYRGLAFKYPYKVQVFMPGTDNFPCDNMHSHSVKRKLKPGEEVWVNGQKKTSGVVHTVERRPYGSKNSPYIMYKDWKEYLVAICAHEARHIWQYKNHKTYANEEEMETVCEKFSLMRLEYYREENK